MTNSRRCSLPRWRARCERRVERTPAAAGYGAGWHSETARVNPRTCGAGLRDEPASELLKRIVKERARLEAEGACKKSKPYLPVSADEQPFALPDGWSWIRLTNLGDFRGGKTPSTTRSDYWDGSIPWVSPKDMKSSVITDTEDYVSDLALSDGLTSIPESSVLVVVRSGILRRTVPVAINARVCTVNQDLKALCLVQPKMARYVQLLLKGFERLILTTLTKVGTTVESIKFDEFSAQPFPLPPPRRTTPHRRQSR